jgi:hypothetical protein
MIVLIAIAHAREARRAGVETVPVTSIAAIVEHRARAPKPTATALKARFATLARLEKRGMTLLPARFGVTVETARELKALLAPHVPTLARALDDVRGRRQMTIRVRGTSPVFDRRSGARYLAALARAAKLPEADALRRAVAKYVVDERIEPAPRAGFRGTVHHLVDARDVQTYLAAASAAAERAPGRFMLTGPMIPFAFVPALAAEDVR